MNYGTHCTFPGFFSRQKFAPREVGINLRVFDKIESLFCYALQTANYACFLPLSHQ